VERVPEVGTLAWMRDLVGRQGTVLETRASERGERVLVGGLPMGPYWLAASCVAVVEGEEAAA
jgi:hypothetical protein